VRGFNRYALAAIVSAGLLVASCGDDEDDDAGGETPATSAEGATETTAAGGDAPATTAGGGGGGGETVLDGTITCEGQYEGETVTLFSSIRDIEAERLEEAYAPFEECTGADLQHEGSGEFEAQLLVRVEGGSAPDIAVIPQPGLMANLARKGQLVENPAAGAYVAENFLAGYEQIGSVDGKFYGAPLSANVKSTVWYNPQLFNEAGYEIPTTLDELKALSDQIVADGKTPWCIGIESGVATGWVITDWMEDFMLRLKGPEVYDQWVNHEIPFNDPQVLEVAEAVGEYVKNEDYIAGGVQSMAVTTFQEGGLGILDGSCYLHRQASFYGNQFDESVEKGPEGQANWFYLPVAAEGDDKVMLTGGEFMAVTAGNDRPVVMDAVMYMTSSEYANQRAALGSWISANKGLDIAAIPDAQDQEFAELLLSSEVARFDGSDSMPSEVGAGSFWRETTAWIVGGSTEDMLDRIEDSWPAS